MVDERLLLVALAFAVALINLPFGYWRAGTRKFSARWFVAVHGPVPAVVALRLATGIPLSLKTLPVLVGAYFGGQLLGARMRGSRSEGA